MVSVRSALAVVLLVLAPAAFAAGANAKAVQFLDKSNIDFPKAIGPYTLVSSSYNPRQFADGVSTEYSLAGAPKDTHLNVYIYPRGRADEATAVQADIAEVEAAIREVVARDTYTDLRVGARSDFVVARPESAILADSSKKKPGDASGIKPEFSLEPSADNKDDPIVRALMESMPPANSHGMRQSFAFSHKSVPMRSMGYVFYRNLFMFKVRISLPEASIGQAEFETLADAAARTLVPAMYVKNFGTCGALVVELPEQGSAGGDAADSKNAAALVREIGRINRENCASNEGDKPSGPAEGFERQVIEYPPDAWKQDS